MRRFAHALAAAALALASAPALAEDAPKLPPTAKLLSGAQIMQLYDGKTVAYRNFTFFGVVTGEVSYDFTTNTNHGTYTLGSHKGTFDGKIRIDGNRFCYRTSRFSERCDTIYLDGATIYEVKPSGLVAGVSHVE